MGSDARDVPPRAVIESHTELLCDDRAERVVIIVLFPGRRGCGIYEVERNHDLIVELSYMCRVWWDAYVYRGIAPDSDSLNPSEEFLKRLRRPQGS